MQLKQFKSCMECWQEILQKSIEIPGDLAHELQADLQGIEAVVAQYPMRINPYYLDLVKQHGKPLWLQVVPDCRELNDSVGMEDPLKEEGLSPVPNIVHKYPDRVLFLVHSQCALYCRFCTRKRKVGKSALVVSDKTIELGIDYVSRNHAITDVLLSGGDPLLLSDRRLEWILSSLRAIPHVEIIRIGSRVPCVLPMRITPSLVSILQKFHPLYINTHFNHPAELTSSSTQACEMLANAGIPLGSQTVLLKEVNDSSSVITALMKGLLRMRVKPYYLFQGDLTQGTNHFRTKVEVGIAIMDNLLGSVSGLALPTLAVDLPFGGGKIPLSRQYAHKQGTLYECTNSCGQVYTYPDGS